MRSSKSFPSIALAALAALTLYACAASRPPGSDPGSPPPAPGISADQQCQIMQAAVTSADLGLVFVNIKSIEAQAAVDAALTAFRSAADSYCAAAAAGEEVDGLSTFLAAYNEAVREFRDAMRAARRSNAITRVEFETYRSIADAPTKRAMATSKLPFANPALSRSSRGTPLEETASR